MERKTKKLILATAERIFQRDGPTASVNAIIADAGLSKGVFFHHFPSKRELLLELAEREFSRQTRRMEAAAAALPEGPGRRLKAYVHAWAGDSQFSRRSRLNMLGMLRDASLRELLRGQRRRLLAALRDPDLPTATVRAVLHACDGFRAYSLVTDCDDLEVAAEREALAGELLRIIDLAVAGGASRARLVGDGADG